MFSVPINTRILLFGKYRILLLFFFLLLFTGLLLFINLLFLKSNIQQQQLHNIEIALNSYLEGIDNIPGSPFGLHNRVPHEIDFIRLIRGKNQLLVTGASNIAFRGLVGLNPDAEGAWVNLMHPDREGSWLLVSKKLGNEEMIQAGKDDSSTGIPIYRQSVAYSYKIFFYAALICLCLAFFFSHMVRAPLRILQKTVKHTLQQKALLLTQNEKEESGDLQPIYQLLEQIFYQNRRLIVEMQGALDNVAHDLRTPMTRLRAAAEYALQSDTEDPKDYRSALSDCLEESERVLSILRVMMSVAEAEAGTMRLERQKVNVLDSLKDVAGLYQYVAEEELITISCEGAEELIVSADQTRLSQVWANLLDNGIKYGHESGTVTITTEKINNHAVIRFCDDGIGISDTEINRIWDRLYRGDRSRTKHGLGLGLNYVKAVVEAHGGQVKVTSKVREGSCFEIYLPLI